MNVRLYDNKSGAEVMSKVLEEITTLNDVEAYNELELIDPTLILSDLSFTDLDKCNYCYIEEFNRYYFCVPTLGNNGIYTLICHIDPLMSFSDEILNLNVIVDKNEYDINPYLNDGSYIIEEREKVEVLNFSDGFNDTGRYILITAGG